MDLHGIASGYIQAINPFTSVTIRHSTGYTVDTDGTQIPTFTDVPASVQIQGLHEETLKHLSDLNIQGVLRRLYIEGPLAGVIRADAHGGDLVVWGTRTWKVVHPLEAWPDWTSVVIQEQVD